MLLVIDANILVGESLRKRGQELFSNPALEIFATQKVVEEYEYELAKRMEAMVRKGNQNLQSAQALRAAAIQCIEKNIQPVPEPIYLSNKMQALLRIPRDPQDWPTVALALVLEAGIWTADGDFLGCGLPTWTTETLSAYLASNTS
ncbi:PIN domain-containing protein [Gloeobacter violaceus]|uniref:Glr1046 protein n=1 Tax=Gloeobacter violaceus (strain ATCC 29082 / PCC 7421) TaxID=251221 RepID=Q7NLS5_GLOVI|nr:PIN domain-containing protein [Gloeobacter violaceus]BAC88987.1 glr1046 [Gloeobacter violaceus PCC 7421]